MITGKINNLKNIKFTSNFNKAIEFIANNNLEELENGKYEIDGDNIFALKSTYKTNSYDESRYEAHEKYIDFQVIIKGKEIMYGGDAEQFDYIEKYDDKKDVAFLTGENQWAIFAKKDSYAIFYPEDIHMPGVLDTKSSEVVKLVIKIHV